MAQTQTQPLSITALIAGLLSVVVAVVFLLTPGAIAFWIAVVLGVIAVLLGVIALVKRQHKAFALIGLVAGAITVLFAIANLVFALVFIGAISI